MNPSELQAHGPEDASVITPVAIAALSLECIQKVTETELDEGSIVNAATSLLSTAYLATVDRKTFKDKIYIFFNEDEKRSIVTLYESSIRRMQIFADGSEAKPTSYTMLAVLNKTIVGQGKKCKAERKIGLSGYRHCWGDKGSTSPQVTLLISGKDYKKSTEAHFVPETKQILIMSLRSKKYVEYMPIIPDERSFSHIEKAIAMTINKKSFLCLLLEKYILHQNVSLHSKTAVFLVENYLSRIPKSALSSLKKNAKKAYLEGLEKGISKDKLKDMEKLCRSLEKKTPSCEPYPLTPELEQVLKRDILELVRERACRYENLHEALAQDSYSGIISLGVEEIVACYPNKAHNTTSALLKKFISQDKVLSQKMDEIHGYIYTCKKHSDGKFSVNGETSQQQPAPDSLAFRVLREYIDRNPQETDCKVDSIIEQAQVRVANKYSSLFLHDIDGITEKITANISKMSVRTEKIKAMPEASILSVDPLVDFNPGLRR